VATQAFYIISDLSPIILISIAFDPQDTTFFLLLCVFLVVIGSLPLRGAGVTSRGAELADRSFFFLTLILDSISAQKQIRGALGKVGITEHFSKGGLRSPSRPEMNSF